MRSFKKYVIPLVLAGLLLSLAGCGGASGKYKVVKTLHKQEYYIGFRRDDTVAYYVTGALKVLQADGTVSQLSRQWFGDDRVKFDSDANALKDAPEIAARTLIVGVDEGAYPVSYNENGQYGGFDVELAKAVCQKLGWQVQFISIQAKDAYVELSSGNVDAAWGGLALDGETQDYAVYGPYMENSLVVAALSGASSRISGKTLVMDVSQDDMDALNANENIKSKFGKITRLTGGTAECFASLDSGDADMIVTNELAVDYLNTH